MLKFGVHKLSQLKRGDVNSIFGGRRKVSASLLNEILDDENADQLYREITLELVDDRGIYKRTSAARFTEFDILTAETLRSLTSAQLSNLSIHDVGVSSARTSVDLFTLLIEEFPNLQYLATDYDHKLYEVRSGRIRIVLSSKGAPIEITYPPFVFTPGRLESAFYPLNHVIRKVLTRYKVDPILSEIGAEGRNSSELIHRNIELFSPAALQLAEETSQFQLGQYDILTPLSESRNFTCIRAMNVLNPTYFSDDELSRILRNFHEAIAPGGLFIVGSNQEPESPVSGCIYRRTETSFDVIRQMGINKFLGSAVEDFQMSP